MAKLIDFNPVRAVDVKLPKDAVFIIANSLAISTKAATAHTRYNLRVVECRLSAIVLAIKLGTSQAEAIGFKTLREVQNHHRLTLQESVANVKDYIHKQVFKALELQEIIGQSLETLFADSPTSLMVLEHNIDDGFKLHDRGEPAIKKYRE